MQDVASPWLIRTGVFVLADDAVSPPWPHLSGSCQRRLRWRLANPRGRVISRKGYRAISPNPFECCCGRWRFSAPSRIRQSRVTGGCVGGAGAWCNHGFQWRMAAVLQLPAQASFSRITSFFLVITAGVAWEGVPGSAEAYIYMYAGRPVVGRASGPAARSPTVSAPDLAHDAGEVATQHLGDPCIGMSQIGRAHV